MEHTQHHQDVASRPGWALWLLVGLATAAGVFLWSEHTGHALTALPYLLVLACPLMHLLHGGHGHHASGTAADTGAAKQLAKQPEEPS